MEDWPTLMTVVKTTNVLADMFEQLKQPAFRIFDSLAYLIGIVVLVAGVIIHALRVARDIYGRKR